MSALRGLRGLGVVAALLLLWGTAAQAGAPERIDAAALRRMVAEATASGAVAVVNYWASWCAPCREEMPVFKALRREFPESRLYLLGVSLDLDEDSYRSFLAAQPLGYPTRLGGEQLMDELQVQAIPRTEVYAPGGKLYKVFSGSLEAVALRAEIAALLDRGKEIRP